MASRPGNSLGTNVPDLSGVAHQGDARFDEAEADVDHGTPWLYREAGAVNPLTILATGWSTGFTKLGEAEFLSGVDRNGKSWSVLVGGVVLSKGLIDGIFEKWDVARDEFVVVETLGRVQAGEVVSMKYLGDREGDKYPYPDFKVSRKPAMSAAEAPIPEQPADGEKGAHDDIPY